MDVHPTPFPGKRRPAASSSKIDSNPKSKSSKETAPAVGLSHCRPKRAFGVPRSTNIPLENPLQKPLSAKSCSKPWKPSGTSTKPSRVVSGVTRSEKPPRNAASGSSEKSKADAKRSQRVCFQEAAPPVATQEVRSIEEEVPDDGVHTPVSLVKPVVPPSTPYHSAENCSKCRLDRLESSSYWVGQIKLAETVGKHFVAAAFFRLALECHAEPFLSLQNELKHYVKRHEAISIDTSWVDLCHAYGLSNDQRGVDPGNLDKFDLALVEREDLKSSTQDKEASTETYKDGCLDFVYINKLPLDVLEEEPIKLVDNDMVELGDEFGKKDSVGATEMLSSPKGSQDGGKNSSKVSKSRLYGKPRGGLNLSSDDPSSKTKTKKSGGSADKSSKVSRTVEASEVSRGESARRNQAGDITRTRQLWSKGKAEEEDTRPLSRENTNHDEIGEDAITMQSI